MPENGVDHVNNTLEDLEGGTKLDSRRLTFTLTPDQFEKLYLTPGGQPRQSDAYKRFGNPTPLGLLGFILCLTTFCSDLLHFHKANEVTSPAVLIGGMYFLGGLALWVTSILEWVLGNTFPATVFGAFGSFWLSFGFLNQPSQGIAQVFPEGIADPAFNSAVGFYLVFWSVAILIFAIASLRTNVIFAFLFWVVDIGFFILAAAYFQTANGEADLAGRLIKASGGLCFAAAISGWYLWAVLVFGSTGIPVALPVGDLSNFMSRR